MTSLEVSVDDASGITMDGANDVSMEDTAASASQPEEVELSSEGEEDEEAENIPQNGSSTSSKSKLANRKQHHVPKIFQDSITVLIPIDVRADLKIAIQKTRQKRIQSIQKRYPSLKKEVNKSQEEGNEGLAEDAEDDKDEPQDQKTKKNRQQKNKPTNGPQRERYGSVMDYLEAKYVKGVMLGDEDEEENIDDASEGQGSIYSKGSFLDDTDLQRDVAEQVMANTTLTKLELEEDDADFFVNVGNLEVEENDYGDHYDPLQDKDTQGTKKRKKSQSASPSTQAKKVKKKKTEGGSDSVKSKKSISSSTSTKKNVPFSVSSKGEKEEKGTGDQEISAKKQKAKLDGIHKRLVGMIKKMSALDLPRKKTKLKVALTCPANKKPGDDLTFTNPHNTDQRLRVKVPKDCAPGSTFKVTVPVKQTDDNDSTTDHNKLPKEFKELLDDYARAYDDWCRAQAEVEEGFALFKEKQAKFAKLAKDFPSSLVSPVDSDYLKKVVRRVRQYKIKKKKADEMKQQKDGGAAGPTENEESDQEDEPEKEVHRTVNIPTAGVEFTKKKFVMDDFDQGEE